MSKKQKQLSPEAWAAVESDYRAGAKTLRQIGSDHGITEGAVRKRAARDGWSRDLSAKIRAEAEALVRKEAVRSEVRKNGGSVPEREIIAANAEIRADVLRSHTRSIGRHQSLAEKMLAELEAQTDNPEDFSRLGELMSDPGDKTDELGKLYRRALSLPGRIDSGKKVAETLKTLIGLERQAFKLDDETTASANSLAEAIRNARG